MTNPKDTTVTLDLEAVEKNSARGHALDFPRTRPSDLIEAVLRALGRMADWIWVALIVIIVANVAGRYIFRVNYIWVEEVQWHLFAIGFLIGIGVAVLYDAHVRVDVAANAFPRKVRAWIEFLGILLVLMPLCYIMIAYAIPFVEASWRRGEISSAPGGLHYRWAIKSVIIFAFAVLGLASFARLLRVSSYLFGFPRARG